MRLEGRMAVVTGAASGIGQATAGEFAKEGADVAVIYLHDVEGAEATRRLVEAAGGDEGDPLGRPAEPREVARLIVYLAPADADYVTSQTFTIDGGLTMNWGQGA